MFILGNLIIAVAKALDVVLWIFYWLILVRALISWVSPDPFNPIVQFLYRSTEPVLEPIRRLLPPMVIDVSPLVAFLAITVAKWFIVQSLLELGFRLKVQF